MMIFWKRAKKDFFVIEKANLKEDSKEKNIENNNDDKNIIEKKIENQKELKTNIFFIIKK